MTFKRMSWVMTVAGFVLGLRFIFAGASLLEDWGLDASIGALVISRRLGMLYLGLALMFFLGREAAPSRLRSAICVGIGTAVALLACTGFFELWAGRVSTGVIVPSIVEVLFAAGFAWVAQIRESAST